jgi:chromosome segregation protein
LKDLRSRFEKTKQERDNQAGDMEGLDSQASGLEEERLLWQGRVKQAGNQEREANRAMHEHKAAVDALSLAMQNRDWVQNGVRRVLDAASKQKTPVEILGITADHLQVEPGRESLVETALGDDLQAILVKTGQDLKKLSDWALESKLGRLRILALDDLAQTSAGTPSGLDSIKTYVSPNQGFEPLTNLFQDTAFCSGLDQAWEAAASLAPGQLVVTNQGHRLDRPGAALLDMGQNENGVLARQNKLAERREKLDQARRNLDQAAKERREAEERLSLLEEESSRIGAQKRELERGLARLEQDLFRVKETGSLKKRELEGVGYHAEELSADYERVAEEHSSIQEKLRGHQDRQSELEQDLSQAREDLDYGKESLEEIRARENQARLEEAAVASETEHARSEAVRLEEDTQKARSRNESLELEIEKADAAIVRLSERKEAEQLRLGGLYQELDEQKQAHQKAKDLHSQAQMQLSDLEQELKQARQEQRRAENACQELDLKYKELLLSRENLCEKIMERCRVDLSTNHQNHLPPEPFDAETARMRLARLRQKLSNLGAVNLEAISEHQALSERYNFLTSQKEDLEESLADLRQAIRKINKTSRQRFNATLEQVNQRLAEIYPVLFSGGQAQLITDPDADPLEAGLHLLVELPGKKVKNLEALSGGEKALSAVAVLFALFLIRPAPFCVLDEVDAPLDEANVNRFHDLVQKLSGRSQIIMITHSRRTMEIMDQLYGVTMEEKGISKILSVNLAQGESMAA